MGVLDNILGGLAQGVNVASQNVAQRKAQERQEELAQKRQQWENEQWRQRQTEERQLKKQEKAELGKALKSSPYAKNLGDIASIPDYEAGLYKELGIFDDITRQKQQEIELQKKKEGAQAIYNLLPDELKSQIQPEQAQNLDPTLLNSILSGNLTRNQQKELQKERIQAQKEAQAERLAQQKLLKEIAISNRVGREDPTKYESVSIDPITGQERVSYKRLRGDKGKSSAGLNSILSEIQKLDRTK